MMQPVREKFKELGRKYKYPCLILALGLVLLLIPGKGKGDRETAKSETEVSAEDMFDLNGFTEKAEHLLSSLSGAGQVQLLLTLDTEETGTYLFDESTREDENGRENQRQTVMMEQSGQKLPVTVSRTYPSFRGAVAICSGGDDPRVALAIKEAISSLTGLGMDKITVLKTD